MKKIAITIFMMILMTTFVSANTLQWLSGTVTDVGNVTVHICDSESLSSCWFNDTYEDAANNGRFAVQLGSQVEYEPTYGAVYYLGIDINSTAVTWNSTGTEWINFSSSAGNIGYKIITNSNDLYNSINNGESGDKFYIPNGNYLIDQIELKDHMIIECESWDTKLLYNGSESLFISSTPLSRTWDVNIKNCYIDANSYTGITLSKTQSYIIDNVKIVNSTVGINITNNAYSNIISNSFIYNTDYIGISINSNSHTNQIEKTRIEAESDLITDYGIIIESGDKQSISDCLIQHPKTAILILDSSDSTISNSWLEDNTMSGLNITTEAIGTINIGNHFDSTSSNVFDNGIQTLDLDKEGTYNIPRIIRNNLSIGNTYPNSMFTVSGKSTTNDIYTYLIGGEGSSAYSYICSDEADDINDCYYSRARQNDLFYVYYGGNYIYSIDQAAKVTYGTAIQSNDYYSGDGTQGMTGTCGSGTTLTIKDGLITACI